MAKTDAEAVQASARAITEDAKAAELKEDADKIADALTRLGDRVRLLGRKFGHLSPGTGSAVSVAAEIQNDVWQGCGSLGPLVWTMLTDAGEHDTQRQVARIAAQPASEGAPQD